MCGHVELGAAGGNHWDPGPSFPWDSVMAMAGGAAPPGPQTKRRSRNMIASTDGDGYWTVTSDGAVYAFGDAEFHGGANSPDVIPPGAEIVGIAGEGHTGYRLLASDGSLYCFGSADFHGKPDRV